MRYKKRKEKIEKTPKAQLQTNILFKRVIMWHTIGFFCYFNRKANANAYYRILNSLTQSRNEKINTQIILKLISYSFHFLCSAKFYVFPRGCACFPHVYPFFYFNFLCFFTLILVMNDFQLYLRFCFSISKCVRSIILSVEQIPRKPHLQRSADVFPL